MSLLYLPHPDDVYIRTDSIIMIEPIPDDDGDLESVDVTFAGAPWIATPKLGEDGQPIMDPDQPTVPLTEWSQPSTNYSGRSADIIVAWADMESAATKASVTRSKRQQQGQEAAVDISKRMAKPGAGAVAGPVTEPVSTPDIHS